MKICMIYPAYPPNYQMDGVGDYTRILVEKLRQRGHDVFIITSGRYAGKDEKVIKIGGGEWGVRELFKVLGKIKEKQFDVVNIQYTPTSFGFGVAFKLLPLLIRLSANDILFVTTFHTLVGGGWRSRISAVLLTAFSHKVISTHEEMVGLFRKWLGIFKGKMTQIPIGSNILPVNVDVEKVRAEFMKKYGIAKNATILINFGFPNPGKGLEILLAALKKLTKRGEYRLVILGAVRDEDVDYRHELKGLVMRQGLAKEVIWIEELAEKEVSGILRIPDMCVLPFMDGISIRRGSLMAAMVHGLPIISTFPRVNVPYFNNGENVLLVRPGDSGALAAAIERAAGDSALRDKLSRNIKETAENFSWDRIADMTAECYGRKKT